jgi:DNA-directed RNA polymerase subunit RPC12/RpoP
MRLKVIDYDAVRVAFDEKFKETWRLIQEGETHLDNLAEGFHEADGVIWRMPTIEAEPVKHGRWIEQEAPNMDTYYDCSACGESFCFIEGSPKDNLYTYCPNCGAKMDGDGNA